MTTLGTAAAAGISRGPVLGLLSADISGFEAALRAESAAKGEIWFERTGGASDFRVSGTTDGLPGGRDALPAEFAHKARE